MDIYGIIINYLNINEHIKFRYLSKEINKYYDLELPLQHYVCNKINENFLLKYKCSLNYLQSNNKTIDDDLLCKFKNLKKIYLPYNENITNEGLKYLSGIHTLYLNNNKNITDEGLKYLSGIHTLCLNGKYISRVQI